MILCSAITGTWARSWPGALVNNVCLHAGVHTTVSTMTEPLAPASCRPGFRSLLNNKHLRTLSNLRNSVSLFSSSETVCTCLPWLFWRWINWMFSSFVLHLVVVYWTSVRFWALSRALGTPKWRKGPVNCGVEFALLGPSHMVSIPELGCLCHYHSVKKAGPIWFSFCFEVGGTGLEREWAPLTMASWPGPQSAAWPPPSLGSCSSVSYPVNGAWPTARPQQLLLSLCGPHMCVVDTWLAVWIARTSVLHCYQRAYCRFRADAEDASYTYQKWNGICNIECEISVKLLWEISIDSCSFPQEVL